jgi:hypothetical protein
MFWRAVLCDPEERVELEYMTDGPEKERRQSRYNATFGTENAPHQATASTRP